MHSAIDYALKQIKLAIPKEVLEKTFLNINQSFKAYRNAVNVDHLITKEVIRAYVLADANLIGANKMSITIQGNWIERLDAATFVVRVPKSFTQSRTITDVISCEYLASVGYTMPYGAQQATSDQTIATNKLLNSYRNPVVSGTTSTEIVGENAIMVMGGSLVTSNLYLTVMVDYDDNLSTLNRSAYLYFGQLCILATKAYIWANKIISMDKAEIDGGYNLNRYTAIVEDYSSAYEDYQEYFKENWRKVSIMSDPIRHQEFIEMITRTGL